MRIIPPLPRDFNNDDTVEFLESVSLAFVAPPDSAAESASDSEASFALVSPPPSEPVSDAESVDGSGPVGGRQDGRVPSIAPRPTGYAHPHRSRQQAPAPALLSQGRRAASLSNIDMEGKPTPRQSKRVNRRRENLTYLVAAARKAGITDISEIAASAYDYNPPSHFGHLFDNPDALERWQNYCSAPASVQNRFEHARQGQRGRRGAGSGPHNLYTNIDRATRKVLKFVKDSGRALLEEMEAEILDNLVGRCAGDTHMLKTADRFERTLVNAITKFHGLTSYSKALPDGTRGTYVHCKHKMKGSFPRPALTLGEFLATQKGHGHEQCHEQDPVPTAPTGARPVGPGAAPCQATAADVRGKAAAAAEERRNAANAASASASASALQASGVDGSDWVVIEDPTAAELKADLAWS